MNKGRQRIGRVMARFMEVPRDVVFDVPQLRMLGREELYIENHQGIIEYGDDKIRLNLERGLLEVRGQGLEIASLRTDEMLITGHIDSLYFIG